MEPIESAANPPSTSAPASVSEAAPVNIDAFTAQPPPPVIAAASPPTDASTPASTEILPGAPTVELPVHHTGWGWVMPSLVFVSLVMLVLYVTPYLLMHW